MYLLVDNGEVKEFPYSLNDLRRDNPNTSFPKKPSKELLSQFGVFEVIETQPPSLDVNSQVAEIKGVFLDGNVYYTNWVVRSMTSDELALRVPNSITKRQAKQMLILGGYYTQVQSMIDAIVDDTERLLAQVFWDDSQTFERHHPQLIAFAGLLGISDAALDQMFIDGAKLT